MPNDNPVTLDFSKAQPITLDFSKAQPISGNAPLGLSASGQNTQSAPPQQGFDTRTFSGFMASLKAHADEYAGKALAGAGLPTSISNVPEWFQHLTGTHPDSQPFWEPIRRAIQNPTQENIVGAVPFVGPASVAMSKDVQKGDYAGAMATLAGTLAVPKVAETGAAMARLPITAASQISDAVANKMYQSTLKPSPASYSPAEVSQLVQTGLENKIPISEAGVRKLDQLVSNLNDAVKQNISEGANQRAMVNKFGVASRLGETANKFATQVNPEADLSAVGRAGNEFLENQPNEIPVNQAQALKQGTYSQLKSKAYGELGSATVEAQKALARGLKEELADQFPEIAGLNAKESKLLGLDEALERAVNRTRNRNVISLGGKILAGGAIGALGGEAGAGTGMGLALAHEVLGDPAIQSRIAIGISRASKIPFPEALARVGAYVASLRTAGEQTGGENR
jgi:hypothetical protein